MKNSLVSIVVPVYNAEDHVTLCLNSILNQTYKNIEVIIVNDGSTDNSKKIVTSFQKKYKNIIRVINKSNSGVADTRNIGVKYASGEYITFCDNDDYMDNNLIETYVNNIGNNDILVGGYVREKYSGKIIFIRKLKEGIISPYIQMASWGKLYNLSFIKKNNIKFLKNAIADDFYFNIFAYNLTNRIKIIDNIGYHWMFNDKSLSNTDSKKLNRTEDLIETLDNIDDTLNIKNYELIIYFYLRTIIYYLLFSCKNVDSLKIDSCFDKLFSWLYKKDCKYTKNKYLSIFNNEGEIFSVKLIIKLFMFLKKIGVIKFFLKIYSKV